MNPIGYFAAVAILSWSLPMQLCVAGLLANFLVLVIRLGVDKWN